MNANDTAILLGLEAVSKTYPDPSRAGGLPVLDDVTVQIHRGECLAIMGPSGCGKSTLLNLIGSLDRPTAGRITLAGQDVASLSDRELATLRNRKIGFVFQQHHLLPQCTVLENVLVPVLVHARRADDAALERAAALLERVGLGDRVDHRPGQLSGGECQRVAVVRALINDPVLLLADEPTGSLDGEAASSLVDLLVELNDHDGLTLLLVTHDLQLAARMQKIYTLRERRLVEYDNALDD